MLLRREETPKAVVVALGALLACGLQSAHGGITNIEVTDMAGDWTFHSQNYVPAEFNNLGLHSLWIEETPNSFDPFDLQITVYRNADDVGDELIGLDKMLIGNGAGADITRIDMQLGFGLGDGFVMSGMDDGLFFGDDPAPKEVLDILNPIDRFVDPPDMTEDTLTWLAGDLAGLPGDAGEDDRAIFWFGIWVPDELFVDGVASFTLREIVTPSPGTLALLVIAALGATGRRRR